MNSSDWLNTGPCGNYLPRDAQTKGLMFGPAIRKDFEAAVYHVYDEDNIYCTGSSSSYKSMNFFKTDDSCFPRRGCLASTRQLKSPYRIQGVSDGTLWICSPSSNMISLTLTPGEKYAVVSNNMCLMMVMQFFVIFFQVAAESPLMPMRHPPLARCISASLLAGQ